MEVAVHHADHGVLVAHLPDDAGDRLDVCEPARIHPVMAGDDLKCVPAIQWPDDDRSDHAVLLDALHHLRHLFIRIHMKRQMVERPQTASVQLPQDALRFVLGGVYALQSLFGVLLVSWFLVVHGFLPFYMIVVSYIPGRSRCDTQEKETAGPQTANQLQEIPALCFSVVPFPCGSRCDTFSSCFSASFPGFSNTSTQKVRD